VSDAIRIAAQQLFPFLIDSGCSVFHRPIRNSVFNGLINTKSLEDMP